MPQKKIGNSITILYNSKYKQVRVSKRLGNGESRKEVIRPDINRAIRIDFQGAKITSDVGSPLVREIDGRFRIIDPMKDCLEDLRSSNSYETHNGPDGGQRVYQIAAGYEDCNDADYLHIDPAFRLALGKDHQVGACRSMLSRWRMTSWVMPCG